MSAASEREASFEFGGAKVWREGDSLFLTFMGMGREFWPAEWQAIQAFLDSGALRQSRAEIQAEALEALAVRLRAIHTEGDFGCPNPRHRCSDLDYRGNYCPDAGTSCDACGEAYPCPTIATLGAEAQRIREGGDHD